MRAGAVTATWKGIWSARVNGPDADGVALAMGHADASPAAGDLANADDKALVEAFLAGRREAFDVIVERHRRHVYQLCFRFMNNHEDASDLAQDVFVRAVKGLRNFKNESSLGTWLYRVAVNVCLNRRALKRPETEPLEPAEHVDTRLESPLDRVLRDEKAEVVRRAIEKLPPKQRATLVL